MSKTEKQLGKVKPKHRPDPEPSRCVTQPKGPKKPSPRYLAERYWPKETYGRCSWGGKWLSLGSSNSLDEAVHQAKKPMRDSWHRFQRTIEVRVVDTTTGEVVWQERKVGTK